MARYAEDRRAYESWCDGDWKAANRLMGEFRKLGEKGVCALCGRKGSVTADHIGPISLGFSQREEPRLRPMCRSCNSSRRNRLSYDDVKVLIKDEMRGINVVSWHSKFIWDKLKHLVKSDEDAELLSQLMRRNMHHVLLILSDIAENGFSDFLRKNFLHENYAYYDIRFEGLDPATGKYKRVIKIPGNKKQYRNNASRYVRIAFESLKKYQEKERRVLKWDDPRVDSLINLTIEYLRRGEEKEALKTLRRILMQLAENAREDFIKRRGSD